MAKKPSNIVPITTRNRKKTYKGLTPEQRFHDSYVKQPNGCWYWKNDRGFFANGYSQFCADGKVQYGHRYSWELANGKPFPSELQSRHLCGNRRCVNPRCIMPGTAAENANDRIVAGTTTKGRKITRVPLTAAEKEEIATLWLSGMSQYAIAKKLGRGEPVISYNVRKYKAVWSAKLKAKADEISKAAMELSKVIGTILADHKKAA